MVRVLLRLVAGLVRSRASLVAENEMLRLQLAAAKARLRGKRVRFSRLSLAKTRSRQLNDKMQAAEAEPI